MGQVSIHGKRAELVNREESMRNVTMQCLATDANLLYSTFIHRSRHDYFSVNWLLKQRKKGILLRFAKLPTSIWLSYTELYNSISFLSFYWQQTRLSLGETAMFLVISLTILRENFIRPFRVWLGNMVRSLQFLFLSVLVSLYVSIYRKTLPLIDTKSLNQE